MNALLNEERAIVSEIAGTTRDTIEDELVIGGIGFRFIDTAGIRETKDYVESIGIQKTFEKIKNQYPLKPLVVIMNKKDLLSETEIKNIQNQIPNILLISAKNKEGIEDLKNQLLSFVNTGALRNNETIVTNTRHYDSLLKALEEIQKVKFGLETNLSSDLMALDIREALYQFGLITGQVTNDELLGNIFANFCIGK